MSVQTALARRPCRHQAWSRGKLPGDEMEQARRRHFVRLRLGPELGARTVRNAAAHRSDTVCTTNCGAASLTRRKGKDMHQGHPDVGGPRSLQKGPAQQPNRLRLARLGEHDHVFAEPLQAGGQHTSAEWPALFQNMRKSATCCPFLIRSSPQSSAAWKHTAMAG